MDIILLKSGQLLLNPDGSPLEGAEAKLADAVVLACNPAAGDVLTYNGSTWVAGKLPLALAIEDPQDGDVLTYDAEAGVWKNTAAASGE